ncbi:alpha/beta hydrolase [Fluoribacter dumoffii]|uniref:alpha/beta hydrolase n=1 Tax=Fluoribacter dumoffii TaxID=463 RepID=UPI002244A09B|nr:alpha/beta fold hydrolase [Fluoribacter dumoffii]MCW8416792.1 alpha/beta hydrolase [Fluoribacter dumoffii]MCW8455368.1 alpha/beta hydrolase [Fluoribacter dumoffii]MCW8460554.1 alpha/beta hydrolase [Fluoribacter dumoffii]MCW8484035.1 alpha/beta hydrolase [Fluoribacter dumoffii]
MAMNNFKKLIPLFFFVFLSLNAYSQSPEKTQNLLISYTYLGTFPKETAQTALNKMPPLDVLDANYEVTLYKINYRTPAPDGHITTASGLLAVPAVTAEIGIVSYQHGTRFNREDAPSRMKESDAIYPALFSSHGGYLTVMPDYLGFGDNELPLHPYVQYETLASSSMDMLLAAKEFAKILKIKINDQLYIGGYSEGGFSSLALFELLATHHPEIPLTAVALGSAPYDWDETMRFIMLNPGPRATAYLAYFFYSLQTYKNYWANLDQIFVSPYNVLVPELFDGRHSTKEIISALPQNPALIFQATFFDAILNPLESDTEKLKNYFNHYDYRPTAPLLLVGTKGDKDVPYHGAEIAYNQFRKYSSAVFIQSVSDTLDHRDAGPYVFYEMLRFFKDFQPASE